MPFIGVQPAIVPLTSSDIADGQITTAKIADTAVTTAKVADDAVGNTKLDLTANYAFTGTITGTKGMTLILDATISSAVSEYDISSTYINSTYDNYYLDASLLPATDNVVGQLFPMVSGSVLSSGVSYATYGHESGQIRGHNFTNVRLSYTASGNASGEHIILNGFLQNVNSTAIPFAFSGYSNMVHTDGLHEGNSVTGALDAGSRASVVNGIRLNFSSGNIASGTVKLYGIKD